MPTRPGRGWVATLIHRLGPLLGAVADFDPRQPVVGGLQFREAMQAVSVQGGVAGNVVPDEATVVLNVRFAPDRRAAEAELAAREVLAPHLADGDEIELLDAAEAAPPAIGHPLLSPLVDDLGLAVNPKLGWTDVARFTSRGVAAVNLGPGDPGRWRTPKTSTSTGPTCSDPSTSSTVWCTAHSQAP